MMAGLLGWCECVAGYSRIYSLLPLGEGRNNMGVFPSDDLVCCGDSEKECLKPCGDSELAFTEFDRPPTVLRATTHSRTTFLTVTGKSWREITNILLNVYEKIIHTKGSRFENIK